MKHALFLILLAFPILGIASEQEPCPKPPPGKTAWFDTCKYPFARNGLEPARAVTTKDPEYPDAARRKKIQGTVIVAAAINAHGTVDEVKVVRSLESSLDRSAVDAVKQWTFKPATKDGQPVGMQVEVEVNFRTY